MASDEEDEIWYIHCRVVAARNIPAADANGFSDPYVKVKLNTDSEHRSPVCPRTLNPVWLYDTTVHTTHEQPAATTKKSSSRYHKSKDPNDGTLRFEMFDEDALSKNDFLVRSLAALSVKSNP